MAYNNWFPRLTDSKNTWTLVEAGFPTVFVWIY